MKCLLPSTSRLYALAPSTLERLFLPTAAPRLLTYSKPLITPLNFQAQAATAGKYGVEASATGYATQLGSEVTATFGAVTPVPNFTLLPVVP